jgi:hypothetical protein
VDRKVRRPQLCVDKQSSVAGGSLRIEREREFRLTDDDAGVMRRDRIRDDIAQRIRNACAHLPDDEFRQLVGQMTDRQLKGERQVNQRLGRG